MALLSVLLTAVFPVPTTVPDTCRCSNICGIIVYYVRFAALDDNAFEIKGIKVPTTYCQEGKDFDLFSSGGNQSLLVDPTPS